MREIVLDTETTGFDPEAGHRLVEIGCVELVNHIPTGTIYHQYINPERDMPEDAFRVHGLSASFLGGHPPFRDIYTAFIDFIADSTLVIHNADFDMKFLNAELKGVGHAVIPRERAIDTVKLSRKKFPGQRASLDALCNRFGIDNSHRDKHGALLDAELLAEVYVELIGGKQIGFDFAKDGSSTATTETAITTIVHQVPLRIFPATAEEEEAHKEFLKKLKNPLWETAL